MSRRSLLVPGALFMLSACSLDRAAHPEPTLRVERVVLVSIDGLRGDALPAMPSLTALLSGAVWTDRARSVEPAITLPAHLSMLTGRDVTELGVTSNSLDAAAATRLLFAGVSTVFAWIDGSGDAVVGASLLPTTDLESARALLSLRRLIAVGLEDAAIIDAALAALAAGDAPDLLFVHLPGVDLAGHQHGWITSTGSGDALGAEYLAAVRHADAQIARLHEVLASDIAAGTTALIVTADHGGGHGTGCGSGPAEQEHCSDHPGDQRVPLVVLASGVTARRLDGEPMITQIAPTIGAMLGAQVPSGMSPIAP